MWPSPSSVQYRSWNFYPLQHQQRIDHHLANGLTKYSNSKNVGQKKIPRGRTPDVGKEEWSCVLADWLHGLWLQRCCGVCRLNSNDASTSDNVVPWSCQCCPSEVTLMTSGKTLPSHFSPKLGLGGLHPITFWKSHLIYIHLTQCLPKCGIYKEAWLWTSLSGFIRISHVSCRYKRV